MGAQVTGTIKVYVDGSSIRSKKGAKINLGGFKRTPIYADGQLIGYTEEPEAAMVTCTLAHVTGSQVAALRDIVDGSCMVETDTGIRYTIRGLVSGKPPEITGGEGDVDVEFFGDPAVEQS